MKKKKNIVDITKDIFLNAIVCPKLGWLMRSEEISIIPSMGDAFRTIQAKEVQKRARLLYVEGLLIKEKDSVLASKKTSYIINHSKIPAIFEATFYIDHYIAKADILKRESNCWTLIEVKSAVKNKNEFLDDMAYTCMVIKKVGLKICKIKLFLISKNFRLGMEKEKFFISVDHTNEVTKREEHFTHLWTIIENITKRPIRPEGNLLFECRKCKLLNECIGKNPENTIFRLPKLTKPKFEKLTKLGIVEMEDIPSDFPLTGYQEIVKICSRTGKPYIGKELKSRLNVVKWPAFYLDFETIITAVPIYEDVAPYTRIPTQYSIHKCSNPGQVLCHREFIANPKKDVRKQLTEQLIKDLEDKGTILVYSGFEQAIINNLAQTFPNYENDLMKLIERLVDLEHIIKYNFYHPNFHGSTSIKKTLPALISEISYDGLEISDGDTAMAVYGFMALGTYEQKEVEILQSKLLEYCKLDTLATVKLHEKLVNYVT